MVGSACGLRLDLNHSHSGLSVLEAIPVQYRAVCAHATVYLESAILLAHFVSMAVDTVHRSGMPRPPGPLGGSMFPEKFVHGCLSREKGEHYMCQLLDHGGWKWE